MFILSYLYLILSKCVYKDGNIYEQILDSLDQYKTNTDFLNAKTEIVTICIALNTPNAKKYIISGIVINVPMFNISISIPTFSYFDVSLLTSQHKSSIKRPTSHIAIATVNQNKRHILILTTIKVF